MGTTDGNNVYFYEETDAVSPLHTLLNTGQQSISDALDDSARIFRVANSAGRTALLAARGSSASEPLLVRQQDNKTYWEHDGTAWRLIAGSGGVPYAFAAGSVTSSALANGATEIKAVTFPAGRFAVAPLVVASTASPRYQVSPTNVTTAGADLFVANFSGGASAGAAIIWHAVQMTDTTAAG